MGKEGLNVDEEQQVAGLIEANMRRVSLEGNWAQKHKRGGLEENRSYKLKELEELGCLIKGDENCKSVLDSRLETLIGLIEWAEKQGRVDLAEEYRVRVGVLGEIAEQV